MEQFIIAIDGLSSSGKTIVGSTLAAKLNAFFIDSGKVYRAFTLFLLNNNVIKFNSKKIYQLLEEFIFTIDESNNMYINNKVIDQNDLHSNAILGLISLIAADKLIRRKITKINQNLAYNSDKRIIIIVGRDAGTVIFKNAQLKIFLDATLEIRAKRRYEEIKANDHNADYNQILNKMIYRDNHDINRKYDPIVITNDYSKIDTTNLTINQVINKINTIYESLNKD